MIQPTLENHLTIAYNYKHTINKDFKTKNSAKIKSNMERMHSDIKTYLIVSGILFACKNYNFYSMKESTFDTLLSKRWHIIWVAEVFSSFTVDI